MDGLQVPGTVYMAGSGAVIGANPTRVYSVTYMTTGAATTISLANGGLSGTVYLKDRLTTTSSGYTVSLMDLGMLFPAGCYLVTDSNYYGATIVCSKEC